MKFDKVKEVKRLFRQREGKHGRGGPHDLKTKREKFRKHARDYLDEYYEDAKDIEIFPPDNDSISE